MQEETSGPGEKFLYGVSGLSVLVEQGLHEQVIDRVQFLVGIQRGQQILPVLVEDLQDHQSIVRIVLILSLCLRREESLLLLAVVFQRVHKLQHDLAAVLVCDCDESGAVLIRHGASSFCLYSRGIVTDFPEDCKGVNFWKCGKLGRWGWIYPA